MERHRGQGSGGFRESTRGDYRRDLKRYALPYFDERLGLKLSEVTPRHVANFLAWLTDEREQGKRLADATVRRIFAPVRAFHVLAGLALIPVLLAKLWAVIPKLYERPAVASISHGLERLRLAVLVGSALFSRRSG